MKHLPRKRTFRANATNGKHSHAGVGKKENHWKEKFRLLMLLMEAFIAISFKLPFKARIGKKERFVLMLLLWYFINELKLDDEIIDLSKFSCFLDTEPENRERYKHFRSITTEILKRVRVSFADKCNCAYTEQTDECSTDDGTDDECCDTGPNTETNTCITNPETETENHLKVEQSKSTERKLDTLYTSRLSKRKRCGLNIGADNNLTYYQDFRRKISNLYYSICPNSDIEKSAKKLLILHSDKSSSYAKKFAEVLRRRFIAVADCDLEAIYSLQPAEYRKAAIKLFDAVIILGIDDHQWLKDARNLSITGSDQSLYSLYQLAIIQQNYIYSGCHNFKVIYLDEKESSRFGYDSPELGKHICISNINESLFDHIEEFLRVSRLGKRILGLDREIDL